MKRKITMIMAVDGCYGLGKDGKIPWNYQEDMAWFYKNTIGKTVVMGHNTFIGLQYHYGMVDGFPDRKNIVLTSDASGMQGKYGDVHFHSNVREVMDSHPEDLMIVGGLKTYVDFAPYAHEILLSKVKGFYKCDTFMTITEYQAIFKGKRISEIIELSDDVVVYVQPDWTWDEYQKNLKKGENNGI